MNIIKKAFLSIIHFRNDINNVILLLWLLITIGLLSLIFPAIVYAYKGDWGSVWRVIGTGLFLAGASTLVGSLLGFLFGVPKSRTAQSESDSKEIANNVIAKYQPNTNLEQVSDWLTKMIIGVGLIQIREIVKLITRIGNFAGPAFGSSPSGEIIAISLVIHYILIGFIQGFLLSYLWLPRAFERATMQQKTDTDSN